MIDTLRKSLNARDIHSFFGLYFSLFLLFVFATGTVAVFSNEIDWLLKPATRVTADQDTPKRDYGAIYDAAKAAQPGWDVVMIERENSRVTADKVTVIAPTRKEYYAYVNPYTAEVQGIGTVHTIKNLMRSIHRRLFLPTKYGVPLVTVFVIPLTVSIVAGLLLYRRFWTGFFRWPNFRGRRRAWISETHRLLGVWSLVFLVPMLLTTYFYFAESLGLRAPDLPYKGAAAERSELLPAAYSGSDLDAATRAARAIYPDLNIREVELPRHHTQAIAFKGEMSAILVRLGANAVYVDPVDGAVLGQHKGEELNAFQRISEAADPLHFGYWGGTASRVFWFAFGLAMTVLAAFGAWIYAERISMRAAKDPRIPAGGALRRYWWGMGTGKYLSIGLVGVGFLYAVKVLLL